MDFMKTIISAIKHWANNRFTVDSTLSTVAKTGRYEDMEGLIDETSIPNSIARIEAGQYSVTATSTNGWLYIATVPHIKELTTGVSFIMIPEITSTSKNPVININNFGQMGIKRNLSGSNANYYEGPFTSWLYAGRPVRLIYNGTCWIAENLSKPDVRDIEGTLSIEHGGTGGTTVANARNNLKVYSKTEVDTLINDLSEEVLLKTEQSLTDTELAQVRSNLKFIGKDVAGQTFNINGTDIVASANAEIFGDYENNKCTGQWSIVEGSSNVATGRACHVEGAQNQALNDGCHVEGVNCIASGYWSHAEGEMTRVTSYASHAEGSYTEMPDGTTRYGTASGYASHIEGGGCHAEASCSHSEGLATTAKGDYAHSEGKYTIASSPAQHVQGAGNIEDAESKYLHIVGNGDFGSPSNAHTLDWQGNAKFAGDLYVNGTGANDLADAKKVATEEFVVNAMEAITFDRIDEICGIEPTMTLAVNEDGDAVISAGFPDDEGNLTI